MRPDIEDFESRLRHLSRTTGLSVLALPAILGDIAGVLMQEARSTLFEDGDEVSVDAARVREELLQMGHDPGGLELDQVRLLLDFFMEQVVDPSASRN